MDKLIIVYSIIAVVTGTILEGTFGGFVNRAGKVFDLIGMYFFFRFMIAEENDLRYVLTFIAVLLIPLGVLLFIEKTQGTNFFSILLKAPLELVIRDGKIRAMGPFQHPILAGTFCATCFPLIATLWWKGKKSKILFVLSTLAILVGIYASNSSGPIMSFIFCLIGFAVFKFRHNMRTVRWMIVLGLVFLQLVMKAPVWFVLAKIDLTGSSTGWHRAELIDSALRHFNEWWLVGTTYTRHWMPTGIEANLNHTDITNQYIALGVQGGILLLATFIYMQITCFRNIGKVLRRNENKPISFLILPWACGVVQFSHIGTFLSIPFFDQTISLVYFIFAVTTFLTINQGPDPINKISNKTFSFDESGMNSFEAKGP